MLGRLLPASARRRRDDEAEPPPNVQRAPDRAIATRPSWDHTARPAAREEPEAPSAPLRLQILGVLADPRVDSVTAEALARVITRPMQDIDNALDAMVRAGELVGIGARRFRLPPQEKERLALAFRDTAREIGEHGVLVETTKEELGDDDGDEPRLPVTAGLLSLFLPGTGQLLNGDVGRASLVFAVWSLAWITHLSPVWTFVCLYAGAEAFFTAKIRSMERRLAKESLAAGTPHEPMSLPPASGTGSR
jgi:hypothetical protein